jgi:oligopeptide/dipeptide ABC transporter ATP-binding protein
MAGIPGSPPYLGNAPAGCRFNPRCPHCKPEDSFLYHRQTTERPQLRLVSENHRVACHLVEAEG